MAQKKKLGLFFHINLFIFINLLLNMTVSHRSAYIDNYAFYFIELWTHWSYVALIFLFISLIFVNNKKISLLFLLINFSMICISSKALETNVQYFNHIQDYKMNNKHMQKNGVSIISANIYMNQKALEEILKKAKQNSPDYIALFEVTNQHKDFMKEFHKIGYFSYEKLEDNPYGITLLSKYPIMGDRNHEIIFEEYFMYFKQNISIMEKGEVKESKKTICGIIFHPPGPMTFDFYQIRNRAYQKVINKMKACDADYKIVAGDMNATVLTPQIKAILDENMKSTTQLESTWYSGLSLDNYHDNYEVKWPILDRSLKFITRPYYQKGFGLGIGIDHVFIEKNHFFKDLEFFHIKGSDHLGIYTKIIFND